MNNLGVAKSALRHRGRGGMAALLVSLPVLAGCNSDDAATAGPPTSIPDARGTYVGTFTSAGENSNDRIELVCSGSIVISAQAGTDWSGSTSVDDGGDPLCAATEDEVVSGSIDASGNVSFTVPSVEADCGVAGTMTGVLSGDELALEGSWTCGNLQITLRFTGER
ncbi:MAG: hypothetical protein JSV95_12505 [Gemmatimonadota bacterium]|nr:MAG: hypothetical protein JSV95_12505 [Gemmatimonadota bacterium]